MPVRYLIYAGLVYNSYAENQKNNINLYSSALQKFPAPRFICFYDGLQSAPEKTVLSLEDAFSEGSHSDISIRVTMYNINFGKNKQLMDDCSPLKEYSMFVKEVRNGLAEGLTIEDAISRAIDKLPDDGSIKSFLVNHKNEVTSMCLTEYDEQKNLNAFKEEGILIGIERGKKEGKKEGEIKLGKLIEKMITMGRIDDVTRAARDESYRELLYKEFGITD